MRIPVVIVIGLALNLLVASAPAYATPRDAEAATVPHTMALGGQVMIVLGSVVGLSSAPLLGAGVACMMAGAGIWYLGETWLDAIEARAEIPVAVVDEHAKNPTLSAIEGLRRVLGMNPANDCEP